MTQDTEAAWWMIERDDLNANNFIGGRRPMYFCWDLRPNPENPTPHRRGRHNWTADWQRGERFATREEAEAHTNGDPLLHVREHSMMQSAMTQDTEERLARVNRRIDLLEQGDPRAATWVADFREILAERQSLSDRIDVLEAENERQYKALNAVRDRCFLADDANREHDILSIVVPITDQARAALHQEGIATVSGRNPATQ